MDVLKKVPVREQDAKVRAANFEEVCLGYNREEAMEEASRCINCKNAQCVKGCPVSINIPGFIEKVKEGDMEAAYQVISASSALPVCIHSLSSFPAALFSQHFFASSLLFLTAPFYSDPAFFCFSGGLPFFTLYVTLFSL